MRFIFVKELINYAKKNKNVYLITSDLGFRAFEDFKKKFPKRFINVGVSENNMIGISAGLAIRGKKVFVYSILPFLVFRSLEQIRNNICHNNFDVCLVGAGGGFSYGPQGISHNTSEDIAIMRSLPNISIYNPGSKIETESVLKLIFKKKSPSFLRLGKAPEVDFYKKKQKLKYGNALVVNKGKAITIFCTGNILENVFSAIQRIQNYRNIINLISVPILKPISKSFFLKNLKSKKILTIEENSKIGGLSTIIDDIFKHKKEVKFKSIALNDKVHKEIGSQKFLRKINNLSENKIYRKVLNFLNERN